MRLRARLLLAAASGSLLFLLAARWLLEYVTPLFLALLVAAAIDPMVDWLESRGVGRRIGALGIIAVFSLAAVGLLWVLAVNVAAELSLLHEQLPGAAREIQALLDRWVKLLQPLVSAVPHPLDDALLETVDAALRGFAGFTAQLLARLGSLPSALATLVLSGMAAYFLIRDKRELGSFWLGLLPGRWRGEARRLKGEIAAGLLGFLRAQTILVAVSGGLSIVGLGLFGYRYAWLLRTCRRHLRPGADGRPFGSLSSSRGDRGGVRRVDASRRNGGCLAERAHGPPVCRAGDRQEARRPPPADKHDRDLSWGSSRGQRRAHRSDGGRDPQSDLRRQRPSLSQAGVTLWVG